jgi:hypothetical protein
MYKIYGDFNAPSQTLLEEFNFFDSALDWFKIYTRRDLGGYESVTLMANDGRVLRCLWENDND